MQAGVVVYQKFKGGRNRLMVMKVREYRRCLTLNLSFHLLALARLSWSMSRAHLCERHCLSGADHEYGIVDITTVKDKRNICDM